MKLNYNPPLAASGKTYFLDDYDTDMLKDGKIQDQIKTGHMQYFWELYEKDGEEKYVLAELNVFGFVARRSLPVTQETLRYVVPEQDDWPVETLEKIMGFTDMDIQLIKMCQKL